MSKGGLLCSVLLLQVCVAQLSLISGSHLTGVRIGRDLLCCQDPIRRARLMSRHCHDEFDGHSADSIFDDEGADTGDEYASIDGAGNEEEEGLPSLPPDGHDGGGGSGGGAKDSSGSGGGGDVECPECGKFFKNDKSMFCHLRSHPNRGYKGSTPPVNKLKLSPDAAAVASSSSSSPPGTDRPPARHSGRDPRLTPLEILCAYAILALRYRGNSQVAQVPPPPSFEKLDAVGAQGGAGGSATGNAAAEFKCNNAGAEAGNQLGNRHEHGDSFVKIPKKRRNMPKEVREAHRKKAKLVPSPKEKRPYLCKHCKAAFATNQALGGHVAGHHREKKVPRLNDSSGMAAGSLNGKLKVEDNDDDDKDLPLPRGVLSEKFSMGFDVPWQSGQQASGRQVRQHSERRNDGLSPEAAAATPTPAPTDDGGGSRLWNIDLNVEAPEQE
ncbi:hypothetical protein C2845_PM16G04840 [Panicum miliaceum]|uniref:C2H2-type domain-containing protein n=1 Tax=Panicum miliaceum TaxID=4540 RepID=A0A3L6PW68_PANMI|nr:hypothetical protein C2845_PM16G04840 [Panicum miliaceum]